MVNRSLKACNELSLSARIRSQIENGSLKARFWDLRANSSRSKSFLKGCLAFVCYSSFVHKASDDSFGNLGCEYFSDKYDTNLSLKGDHQIGTLAPLHLTALGKILMAYNHINLIDYYSHFKNKKKILKN